MPVVCRYRQFLITSLEQAPSLPDVPLPPCPMSCPSNIPPKHNGIPRSPSFPRPIPPTPRKMSASKDSRRRSLVTAIPRPMSGSSRKAASSDLPEPVAERNATDLPFKPVRGSVFTDHSCSSTSDRLLPGFPASQSSSLHGNYPTVDLSGIKQQLEIRHHSAQFLTSPSKIAFSSTRLPKSSTTSNLSVPSRELTPHRTLLKPLNPPLPNTQSATQISCFSTSTNTPSPSRARARPVKIVRNKPSQVNVVDALRESRMTDDELHSLNAVRKEFVANQKRFRTRFDTSLDRFQALSSDLHVSSHRHVADSEDTLIKLSNNNPLGTTILGGQKHESCIGAAQVIDSFSGRDRICSSVPALNDPILAGDGFEADPKPSVNVSLVS